VEKILMIIGVFLCRVPDFSYFPCWITSFRHPISRKLPVYNTCSYACRVV